MLLSGLSSKDITLFMNNSVPAPESINYTQNRPGKYFCRYCGSENEQDALFCEACGKRNGV